MSKEETRERRARRDLVEKLTHGIEYVIGRPLKPRVPGAVIESLSPEEREVCKTLTTKDFGFEHDRLAHWTAMCWRDTVGRYPRR